MEQRFDGMSAEDEGSKGAASIAIVVLVIIAALASWSGAQPAAAPSVTEEKAEDKIARYTEWLALLTGGLVLVSAVQIWFLTQADRTARKTAGAALKAAEATESSVEIAKSALRDTERPFVYLKTVDVLIERAPSTFGPIDHTGTLGTILGKIISCTFTPLWGNSGRTPARRVLTYSNIKKFDSQLPDSVSFDEDVIPKSGVLGPNTEMYGIGSKIDEDEYYKLLGNELTMIIMGWADYDDVFPGTSRHRTEFCLQIKIVRNEEGTRVVLPSYSRLNGFDDECQNKPKPYYPPPS
jgi:hypothetical protein